MYKIIKVTACIVVVSFWVFVSILFASNVEAMPSRISAKANKISDYDFDILIRTIYGEVRGQSTTEIRQATRVALARYHVGFNGQRTLAGVLKDPWQFSVWNKGDKNRPIVTSKNIHKRPNYWRVRRIVLEEALAYKNKGASVLNLSCLHYYHKHGMKGKRSPRWSVGKPKRKVGTMTVVCHV